MLLVGTLLLGAAGKARGRTSKVILTAIGSSLVADGAVRTYRYVTSNR